MASASQELLCLENPHLKLKGLQEIYFPTWPVFSSFSSHPLFSFFPSFLPFSSLALPHPSQFYSPLFLPFSPSFHHTPLSFMFCLDLSLLFSSSQPKYFHLPVTYMSSERLIILYSLSLISCLVWWLNSLHFITPWGHNPAPPILEKAEVKLFTAQLTSLKMPSVCKSSGDSKSSQVDMIDKINCHRV